MQRKYSALSLAIASSNRKKQFRLQRRTALEKKLNYNSNKTNESNNIEYFDEMWGRRNYKISRK